MNWSNIRGVDVPDAIIASAAALSFALLG